jgi:hypothetical protein
VVASLIYIVFFVKKNVAGMPISQCIKLLDQAVFFLSWTWLVLGMQHCSQPVRLAGG